MCACVPVFMRACACISTQVLKVKATWLTEIAPHYYRLQDHTSAIDESNNRCVRVCVCVGGGIRGERAVVGNERERERDRQTETQRDRDREIERQRDRDRDRDRNMERDSERNIYIYI